MNIIIANTQEFNPQIGGVERVSSTLAKELSKMGHAIFFVAYLRSSFSKKYIPVVEQLLLPNVDEAFSDQNVNTFAQFVIDKKIVIILNQAGNILEFTKLCVAVKDKTNTKLVSEIHINPDFRLKLYLDFTPSKLKGKSSLREICKRNIKRIYPYKLSKIKTKEKSFYKYLYLHSDKVVLLSEYFEPKFIDLIDAADSTKIASILNPLSFQVKNVDLSRKKKQLLYAGRFDFAHKRPDRVLEIWNLLYDRFPDWELIMLGDGPIRNELEDLSKKLKLERIKFVGFQDPKSYYEEASIILMTSTIEGLPMVLVEAMQYGVIPVACDTFESIQEIIEDEVNGYRIKAPFIKNGSKVISNLMGNLELRNTMANASLAKISKFSLNKIVNEWLGLFSLLLK